MTGITLFRVVFWPVLAPLILAAMAHAQAVSSSEGAARGGRPGEWRVYGGDDWGTRYSPLTQIHPGNFKNVKLAWRWSSIDNPILKERPDLRPGPNEGTPLMVDGMLYTVTSLNLVAAIDAGTGRSRWTYNPGVYGSVHRGLAYWEGVGAGGRKERRLFLATNDFNLIALDAETGTPVPSFGRDGKVDLVAGLRRPVARPLIRVTSPPAICRDVVIVGSAIDDFQDRKEMPPGDVRGYDARTGRLLWTFHTVPQEGEFGVETWEEGSWKYTGNTNVWTVMSCDQELGYVYLPVSTATNDWYGGHRKGDNLFSESLVCLDARTGTRVWHFQIVHHGLWDYDLPCAPNLLDVTVDGKKVKAVAQVTKQAFCFVFDRVTGRPLWPIVERPVPPTPVPGDRASKTQPFPSKPKAFDLQGARKEDLIAFTPELKKEAEKLLAEWRHGPLYTPPGLQKSMLVPGWVGGASWAGAAVDPETGHLYVPSVTNPMWLRLEKPKSALADVRYKIGENGYRVPGPRGLPLFRPPWGRVTAIDLNTGEHRWMAVQGDGPRNHPAIRHLKLPPLGIYHRTYCLVTKTLLITMQEGSWFGQDPPDEPARMRAFDKKTGKLIAQIAMPTHATGAPITYEVGGKQYIVVPVGGQNLPAELLAFSLP